MDSQSLFRQIISLASLAYTFTSIHAIQYSMQANSMDSNDDDLTLRFASTSTHGAPQAQAAAAASASEKTSGRWTDSEVHLLLDYVEANCILTTPRGLNLKKTDFKKAHDMVKSKDAAQCHYKWGHVRTSVSMKVRATELW